MNKRSYVIAVSVVCLLLSGCCDSGGRCIKVLTVRGTVNDQAGDPISGAEVVIVSHYGTNRVFARTKSDGTYSHSWGPYVGLGNGYLIFRKAGYQDVNTESTPLGDGNGCHDQIIIRDAVMQVAP